MAEMRSYFADNDTETLMCPVCGWSGRARAAGKEYFRELMHYECPSCRKVLRIVPYPTVDEMRAWAAAGNEKAIRELAEFDRLSERFGEQRPD